MARGRNSNRGGYQQPSKPAPVSNPGTGARTDGGAGSARQPLRVAPGQPYGQRQASLQQQRSAPLAVAGDSSLPAGGSPQPAAVAPPPVGPDGVFGPSEMAGVTPAHIQPVQQPMLDADTMLRIMYEKYPSPWIARLMRGAG